VHFSLKILHLVAQILTRIAGEETF